MKSFEQIAKSMYEAFRKTLIGGLVRMDVEMTDWPWDELHKTHRDSWIEAAKTAYREFENL